MDNVKTQVWAEVESHVWHDGFYNATRTGTGAWQERVAIQTDTVKDAVRSSLLTIGREGKAWIR